MATAAQIHALSACHAVPEPVRRAATQLHALLREPNRTLARRRRPTTARRIAAASRVLQAWLRETEGAS